MIRYRITSDILRPFRLISSQVKQISKTRLEIRVTIKSVFSKERFGKQVQVIIPLPSNTAECKTTVASGRAKYKSSKSALVWT
jgi:AP-2 complex subunit mu-1